MNKRNFLAVAAGSATIPVLGAQPGRALAGLTLLTVTGVVGAPNRGPFDPVLDQMMAKQKVQFEKAYAFDFAALALLPAVTVKPTLEYDNRRHSLKGPLLTDVLEAAGVKAEAAKLSMRAVDGYAPSISLADARKYGFILATHAKPKTPTSKSSTTSRQHWAQRGSKPCSRAATLTSTATGPNWM